MAREKKKGIGSSLCLGGEPGFAYESVRCFRLRLFFMDFPPKFFPHLDHTLFHFRSEVRVGLLGRFRLLRRIDGVSKLYLQRSELLKLLAARPGFEKAINRDGHDRHLHVDGKDSRSFFESARRPVDPALALGIKYEIAAVAQTVSPGFHGWHQVGVGIDNDNTNRTSQLAHEACAENLAGANRERVHESIVRQHRSERNRVEITLMV